MAFETVFASEIPLSAIKPMICRRFSSFRFWFSGFIEVLSQCNGHHHSVSEHGSYSNVVLFQCLVSPFKKQKMVLVYFFYF